MGVVRAEIIAIGSFDLDPLGILRENMRHDSHVAELDLGLQRYFTRDEREGLGNNEGARDHGHDQPWHHARFRRVGFSMLSFNRHAADPLSHNA